MGNRFGRSATNVLALLIVASVAPVVQATWTDPGPTVGTPDSSARMIKEDLDGESKSMLKYCLKFTLVDPSLTGGSGTLRSGLSKVFYDPAGPSTGTYISSVAINRFMYLTNATMPGTSSVTLAAQIHTVTGFSMPSTGWYTTVQGSPAVQINPSIDWLTAVSSDDIDLGEQSGQYVDYVFVIVTDASFVWTEYRANVSGGGQNSFWLPPSTFYGSNWSTGATSISTYDHTGAFYGIEKRTLRVYYRKDLIVGAHSVDTRVTYGQPDSTGSIPTPDPNEPSQYVDFSSSTFSGGLFLGKSKGTGSHPDRSGRAIIQGVALIKSVSSPKTRLARGLTLFCPERSARPDYSTATVPVNCVIPEPAPRTLSDLLSDPKRWGYRWKIPESNSTTGEPTYVDQLSIGSGNAMYTWLIGSGGVTGDNQLFALYPNGILPKLAEAPDFPITWHYFQGLPFFASSDIPSELKYEVKKPHTWDLTRDELTTDGNVYQKIRWDPSWSVIDP